MELRKQDASTSFGLTARYSKNAEASRKAISQIKAKATKAIDAAKDEFAKTTEAKGIKGEFCITDIIAKTKDDFVVRFFIKETDKKLFSDQFTINTERDLIKKKERGVRTVDQKSKNKSNHNLQEHTTNKFQESYDKNEQKSLAQSE